MGELNLLSSPTIDIGFREGSGIPANAGSASYVYSDTPDSWEIGRNGYCGNFTSSTKYYELNTSRGSGSISMYGWFNIPDCGSYYPIIMSTNYGGTYPQFTLYLFKSGSNAAAALEIKNEAGVVSTLYFTVAPFDVWAFLGICIDVTNLKLISCSNYRNNSTDITFTPLSDTTNIRFFYHPTDSTKWYKGKVCRLKVFNQAMSHRQFNAIYLAAKGGHLL